jgi:hypothetical protein
MHHLVGRGLVKRDPGRDARDCRSVVWSPTGRPGGARTTSLTVIHNDRAAAPPGKTTAEEELAEAGLRRGLAASADECSRVCRSRGSGRVLQAPCGQGRGAVPVARPRAGDGRVAGSHCSGPTGVWARGTRGRSSVSAVIPNHAPHTAPGVRNPAAPSGCRHRQSGNPTSTGSCGRTGSCLQTRHRGRTGERAASGRRPRRLVTPAWTSAAISWPLRPGCHEIAALTAARGRQAKSGTDGRPAQLPRRGETGSLGTVGESAAHHRVGRSVHLPMTSSTRDGPPLRRIAPSTVIPNKPSAFQPVNGHPSGTLRVPKHQPPTPTDSSSRRDSRGRGQAGWLGSVHVLGQLG